LDAVILNPCHVDSAEARAARAGIYTYATMLQAEMDRTVMSDEPISQERMNEIQNKVDYAQHLLDEVFRLGSSLETQLFRREVK
jgi:hypothetical protein